MFHQPNLFYKQTFSLFTSPDISCQYDFHIWETLHVDGVKRHVWSSTTLVAARACFCKKTSGFQSAPECTMQFPSLHGCDKLRRSVFCSFRRNNCGLFWAWSVRQEVLPGWCIPSQRRRRWWCEMCCQIAPPKQPAEESRGLLTAHLS